jgi:FemAB-related protein (PEP-CTERM system-associated)
MERTMLEVQELSEASRAEWDAFVRSTPGGLPLHLSGWQDVLAATYDYRTYFLIAQERETIRGVMPLFIVPSLLTGKRMMTMPGGLCAVDEAAALSLLDRAEVLAGEEALSQVVVHDSREVWTEEWQVNSDHVYWLLALDASEEALWKRLDGNIRRQVRKARKNGLKAEIDRGGTLLEPFYDMFSRFTHQVGTPVFGIQFLENIIEQFPNGFNIALVWHDEQPIAGYFQLEMGDTMYGMWGAALPESLKLRSAYLALWEIMSDAIANGFSYLDMGRSPVGSNASKFKGQWGGDSAPIYQLTHRENGQSDDNNVINQVKSDQRYQLFMQLWPKLPLSVSKRLGPKFRWHIPFA